MIISVFKLCIFCISHHLHVSFLLRVKVNSTNWPSPNVWVFIAQLVEHCSANSEAMGLNPVEVPKFFSGLFAIGLLHLEVMTNASFKQWLGILLMTKIDRAHKSYVTPEIWEEMHLREIFYGTLIFQQSIMIFAAMLEGILNLALQHSCQNYFLLVSC